MYCVCVEVDGDGVVSVKPDFNAGQPPYRIETRNRGIRMHIIICILYTVHAFPAA